MMKYQFLVPDGWCSGLTEVQNVREGEKCSNALNFLLWVTRMTTWVSWLAIQVAILGERANVQ